MTQLLSLLARFVSTLCVLACTAFPASAAQPVYKCTEGGRTMYADLPCTAGHATVLPPPAAGVQPDEAQRVPTGDARMLLEAEKLNLAREREREQARARTAKEDARAERAHAHAEKAAAAKRKQCDRLRLRVKWADEDVARAQGRKRDAARVKARRAAETMAVECPA